MKKITEKELKDIIFTLPKLVSLTDLLDKYGFTREESYEILYSVEDMFGEFYYEDANYILETSDGEFVDDEKLNKRFIELLKTFPSNLGIRIS